jgi:hypothetical protein
LVACIALSESFLRLTVIVPRNAVDGDLVFTGIVSEKMTVKWQSHSFIDASIFDSWIDATFISELRKCREAFQDPGPTLLL